MMMKFFGTLSIIVGMAFIFVFPANRRYQPEQFTKLGILIGIILILFGIISIKFL